MGNLNLTTVGTRTLELKSALDYGGSVDVLNKSKSEIVVLAVNEAINRLGLVNASACPIIVEMILDERGLHPRTLCTAHRKAGEQLSKDELKAIGVRANAFMSRAAFEEITELGLDEPLTAHEKTALRAYFSYARWRSLWRSALSLKNSDIALEAVSFYYDMLPPMCASCAVLDGTKIMPIDAHILPSPECECQTANYGIRMKIDFFYGIN